MYTSCSYSQQFSCDTAVASANALSTNPLYPTLSTVTYASLPTLATSEMSTDEEPKQNQQPSTGTPMGADLRPVRVKRSVVSLPKVRVLHSSSSLNITTVDNMNTLAHHLASLCCTTGVLAGYTSLSERPSKCVRAQNYCSSFLRRQLAHGTTSATVKLCCHPDATQVPVVQALMMLSSIKSCVCL